MSRVSALERRLGHRFRDAALVEQALTHRSFGSPHNERLEFLGDSVLGCVIAEELFARFPQLPEGKLTRLRASLVREWGRIGFRGQMMVETHPDEGKAITALMKLAAVKKRRGYVD